LVERVQKRFIPLSGKNVCDIFLVERKAKSGHERWGEENRNIAAWKWLVV